MVTEKLPPYNLDAEEAVLGSLLIDFTIMPAIAEYLNPSDFYREKHRWTYEACRSLYRRGEPTNQILVAHELARLGRLEASGGAAYIGHLVSVTPTSVHAKYYADIVKRMSFARKLIVAGDKIAAIGYEMPVDIKEALYKVNDIIIGIHSVEITKLKGAIDLQVRKE